MKTAFKIAPVTADDVSMHLLIEYGKESLSFLFFSKDPNRAEGLLSYRFEDRVCAAQLTLEIKEILANEPLLRGSFSSVNVIYNVNEATLLPRKYFDPRAKSDVLELLFGWSNTCQAYDESVSKLDIINVYRVPTIISATLREFFPFSSQYHINSLLLSIKSRGFGNVLDCIIYHNCVRVILRKGESTEFAGLFEYHSATDVVYHLLNVSSQHGIEAKDMDLHIAGMIDVHSNLKDELFKYFLNIRFAETVSDFQLAEQVKEFPVHFFSHLILLAKCV